MPFRHTTATAHVADLKPFPMSLCQEINRLAMRNAEQISVDSLADAITVASRKLNPAGPAFESLRGFAMNRKVTAETELIGALRGRTAQHRSVNSSILSQKVTRRKDRRALWAHSRDRGYQWSSRTVLLKVSPLSVPVRWCHRKFVESIKC